MFDAVEEEEFEMQQEFLEYYMSAPVAGIFSTVGEQPIPNSTKKLSMHQLKREITKADEIVDWL